MADVPTELIEIDRVKLREIGGTSLYCRIPKPFRRETDAAEGDELVWYRDTRTGEMCIRIEKQTPSVENGTERPANGTN